MSYEYIYSFLKAFDFNINKQYNEHRIQAQDSDDFFWIEGVSKNMFDVCKNSSSCIANVIYENIFLAFRSFDKTHVREIKGIKNDVVHVIDKTNISREYLHSTFEVTLDILMPKTISIETFIDYRSSRSNDLGYCDMILIEDDSDNVLSCINFTKNLKSFVGNLEKLDWFKNSFFIKRNILELFDENNHLVEDNEYIKFISFYGYSIEKCSEFGYPKDDINYNTHGYTITMKADVYSRRFKVERL